MLISLTSAIFLVNACNKDGSAGPAGAIDTIGYFAVIDAPKLTDNR